MKILIADDDANMRELLERTFRGDGHDVVVSCDGSDALSQASAHSDIDVVLSDVSMPGVDGLALAEKLLDGPLAARIILMSGLDSELQRVASLKARGVKTIAKPFSLDDIRKLVRGE